MAHGGFGVRCQHRRTALEDYRTERGTLFSMATFAALSNSTQRAISDGRIYWTLVDARCLRNLVAGRAGTNSNSGVRRRLLGRIVIRQRRCLDESRGAYLPGT